MEAPGNKLVSWSRDGTIRLWDLDAVEQLNIYDGSSERNSQHLFLSDNETLVASDGSIIQLHNLANGSGTQHLTGHTDTVSGLIELANGNLLSWDCNALYNWLMTEGKPLNTFTGHTGSIVGAMESYDHHILSWSADATIRRWDPQVSTPCAKSDRHKKRISGTLILSDQNVLSWSDDNTLRIWDSKTGNSIHELEGHQGWIKGVVQPLPHRIVSWSSDGTLRIWSTRSGRETNCIPTPGFGIDTVIVLPSGRILSWSEEKLRIWSAEDGQEMHQLVGHSGWIHSAAAISGGRILSRSSESIMIWDESTGTELRTLNHGQLRGAEEIADQRILSWGEDKTLRLWDLETGELLRVFEGHNDLVSAAVILSDNRVLSVEGFERLVSHHLGTSTLRIWNLESGELMRETAVPNCFIDGAIETKTGDILAWSFMQDEIHLWDMMEEKLVAVDESASWDATPELSVEYLRAVSPERACGKFALRARRNIVELRASDCKTPLAVWNCSNGCKPCHLTADGKAIAIEDSHRISIIELRRGQDAITLADLTPLVP